MKQDKTTLNKLTDDETKEVAEMVKDIPEGIYWEDEDGIPQDIVALFALVGTKRDPGEEENLHTVSIEILDNLTEESNPKEYAKGIRYYPLNELGQDEELEWEASSLAVAEAVCLQINGDIKFPEVLRWGYDPSEENAEAQWQELQRKHFI